MSWTRRTLFVRAFAALALAGAAAVAASALFLWNAYRSDSLETVQLDLERVARQVAEDPEWIPSKRGSVLWLSRYDASGALVQDSEGEAAGGGDPSLPPEVAGAVDSGLGLDLRRATPDSRADTLFVAVRGPAGIGRAALTLTRLSEARVAFVRFALASMAWVIAASAAAAAWLSLSYSRAAAPLVEAAREVAEGGFGTRIRTDRGDELGDLARAVDAVADRTMAILRQAEEERGELRAILDNAAEGIVVLGPGGRIQLINAAARRIFDAPPDATGRAFVEVTRNSQIQKFLDHIREGPVVQQIDAQIGDTDPRTVRIAGGRIPDVKPNEGRVVLLATDVSDLRRLERLRVDFVANASHELKTPLSSILGYAETLRDDPDLDASTRQAFLDTILRNAHRLEELVGDMLRLARLDSDAETFHFALVHPVEVVDRVLQEHESEARGRGVDLKCRVEGHVAPITADAELLHQCLSNLVGNAVKFTPRYGSVKVVVQTLGDGVSIEVNDTGAGIGPEHLPRIFERFYRADSGRARDAGGTGLGLAIAKHAAVVHGGRIDVESEIGKGSRFRVFLPSKPSER